MACLQVPIIGETKGESTRRRELSDFMQWMNSTALKLPRSETATNNLIDKWLLLTRVVQLRSRRKS